MLLTVVVVVVVPVVPVVVVVVEEFPIEMSSFRPPTQSTAVRQEEGPEA